MGWRFFSRKAVSPCISLTQRWNRIREHSLSSCRVGMDQTVRQEMLAMLPRLRRFAYGLTGSVDSGDDLVQSACERALARLHQWEPGTRLDSWMFRIMKNLWLDDTRAA